MITKGIKIYNTTTSYTGQLTEISGNISCLSSRGNNVTTRQRIDITYLTYVLPTVVLSINQKRSDHVIKVKHGDIQITCHAYGSRPMANLTLLYENQPLDNLTNITIFSTDNDVTFDTVATLNVKLEDNTGTISCVCAGMYWEPILTEAQFKVTEPLISPTTELLSPTSEVQTQQSSQKSYLFVMPFIFVISLLGVVGFFLHKVKAVRASVMQVNQELPMDISKENRTKGGTLNQSTSLEDEPMSVMESTRFSVKSQKEMSFAAHTDDDSPRPPDLQLPDIPITAGMVSCSVEESADDVYYSSVKETATQGRIFYAKDMRLILNMKMGDFYNRWMGTIGASTDKTKCVLITTVSEKSLQKKELHWDDYVKRVLEMPNSRNLPIAEGICIDAAHLYLVQEHFICETLDVRVNTSLETEGATHVHASLDMAEIKRYVLDITEGMVAIHSYGFLHPGLSTKKILLSQQGICKLYDFCLSEDAVKVVPVKKAKGLSSVNQLAPEALQRNEYNWASDVWSLAVLIWEIFSGGIPPFVSDAGATDYANNVPNPESVWPSHLKSLQNELLLSCWDAEAYFRPTVNDLKISYLQVFESVRTDETYQVRRSTLMDLYVPMKGATSSTGSGETPSTND
ncbi:hypothetical protein BSL78_17592 [Apostichopus japonicus]|uniref:Protein kinase domain-containing protein n=1 Tax=Stichopus japonicus TaxID=307972 RepID=A0A2G8KC48_STIJA|nr:hypothetical protein BSL78_17592 [Apostichopus japonicus]